MKLKNLFRMSQVQILRMSDEDNQVLYASKQLICKYMNNNIYIRK